MTIDEWNELSWFTPYENWGEPEKMSFELLVKLDTFRDHIGHRVIVHCGYATEGHTDNSMHYVGQGVDVHVVGVSLVEAWLECERFDFGGIGLYPNWENPGLHLDVRYARPGARWIYTDKFKELNVSNLEGLL